MSNQIAKSIDSNYGSQQFSTSFTTSGPFSIIIPVVIEVTSLAPTTSPLRTRVTVIATGSQSVNLGATSTAQLVLGTLPAQLRPPAVVGDIANVFNGGANTVGVSAIDAAGIMTIGVPVGAANWATGIAGILAGKLICYYL